MNLKPDELPEALQHPAPRRRDPRDYDYIRDELRAMETQRRLRNLRRLTIAVTLLGIVLAVVGLARFA